MHRFGIGMLGTLYTIFVPSGDPYGQRLPFDTVENHPFPLRSSGRRCSPFGNTSLSADRCLYASLRLSSGLSDYHYGWVASGIVVLLLAVFLGLGFRKALKQKSIFGQMVSLTILCTFTAEILLYIPANLGIWLIAPIALPFLSYGATASLINMALAAYCFLYSARVRFIGTLLRIRFFRIPSLFNGLTES